MMKIHQSATTSHLLLLWLLLLLLLVCFAVLETKSTLALAFAPQQQSLQQQQSLKLQQSFVRLAAVASNDNNDDNDDNDNNDDNDDNDNDSWDANVDYDKEWDGDSSSSSVAPNASNSNSNSNNKNSNNTPQKSNPDPSTAWDDLPSMPEKPVLGIDVSLDPISEQEAAEIKSQAEAVINQQFDKGIQDIEKMRTKMNRELEQSRRAMQFASEMNAKTKSDELLSKIDKLTDNFLTSNTESRRATKLAAAASKAMEGTGQGVEMGTWGTIGGRTVLATSADDSSSSLLGSVDNAAAKANKKATSEGATTATTTAEEENRIIIVADTKQDPLAKQLVPALLDKFNDKSSDIGSNFGLQVDVLTPTSTMPLGGNNADCVIVLTTSLTQPSSLTNIFDRLLRKTLQADGKVGQPPTQLVGISTVGTERYDKFPYSFQNMMGGKLETRRQIEEVVINQVKRRVTEPPLDYTLIKLGEFKKNGAIKEFDLKPGDVLDDPTDVATAVETIVQAVAYQPFARNSTLCVSGSMPTTTTGNVATNDNANDNANDEESSLFWDKSFLCLDGPEVWRDENIGDVERYDQLVEYLQGWGTLLAETGKGLTTPVTSELLGPSSSRLVQQQEGIELLFLPTRTGRNYVSKTEERQRESESSGQTSGSGNIPKVFNRKTTKEGGIDIVVEITKDDKDSASHLRVRARRCNYGDDTPLKELSEETILKQLQKAMEVWEREHL